MLANTSRRLLRSAVAPSAAKVSEVLALSVDSIEGRPVSFLWGGRRTPTAKGYVCMAGRCLLDAIDCCALSMDNVQPFNPNFPCPHTHIYPHHPQGLAARGMATSVRRVLRRTQSMP